MRIKNHIFCLIVVAVLSANPIHHVLAQTTSVSPATRHPVKNKLITDVYEMNVSADDSSLPAHVTDKLDNLVKSAKSEGRFTLELIFPRFKPGSEEAGRSSRAREWALEYLTSKHRIPLSNIQTREQIASMIQDVSNTIKIVVRLLRPDPISFPQITPYATSKILRKHISEPRIPMAHSKSRPLWFPPSGAPELGNIAKIVGGQPQDTRCIVPPKLYFLSFIERICYLKGRGCPTYQWTWLNCTATDDLPEAPTNLTATATSSETILLRWTDNSDNETGFQVDMTVGGSIPFWTLGSVSANQRTASIADLEASTQYFFRVCALYESGCSEYSNTANAMTHSSPDLGPPKLKIINSLGSQKLDEVVQVKIVPVGSTYTANDELTPDTQNCWSLSGEAIEIGETETFDSSVGLNYLVFIGLGLWETDLVTGICSMAMPWQKTRFFMATGYDLYWPWIELHVADHTAGTWEWTISGSYTSGNLSLTVSHPEETPVTIPFQITPYDPFNP